MLGSMKIETDVGFTPTLIPACCNSPELLKEPTVALKIKNPPTNHIYLKSLKEIRKL